MASLLWFVWWLMLYRALRIHIIGALPCKVKRQYMLTLQVSRCTAFWLWRVVHMHLSGASIPVPGIGGGCLDKKSDNPRRCRCGDPCHHWPCPGSHRDAQTREWDWGGGGIPNPAGLPHIVNTFSTGCAGILVPAHGRVISLCTYTYSRPHSKRETFTQCWLNACLPSVTLAQP